MIIEVAGKGALALGMLTAVIIVLVAEVGFLISAVLNGYFLVGAKGALVLPTLLVALYVLWKLRRLILHAYARKPLVFALDGRLNYVGPGHAAIPLADVACYTITGRTFARLHFYAADNRELRHYPLWLSSSPRAEVVERLAALGLHPCFNEHAVG